MFLKHFDHVTGKSDVSLTKFLFEDFYGVLTQTADLSQFSHGAILKIFCTSSTKTLALEFGVKHFMF